MNIVAKILNMIISNQRWIEGFIEVGLRLISICDQESFSKLVSIIEYVGGRKLFSQISIIKCSFVLIMMWLSYEYEHEDLACFYLLFLI